MASASGPMNPDEPTSELFFEVFLSAPKQDRQIDDIRGEAHHLGRILAQHGTFARSFLELRQHSANGLAAGSAAALLTEADELLDPLPGIDLGRVQVAVGIDTDLVKPMELTGFASAPPEAA